MASMRTTESAHKAIKAPGKMPNTSTSKPFVDKTKRTSSVADRRTSTCGWVEVNLDSRGISHSDANPGVQVMLTWRSY